MDFGSMYFGEQKGFCDEDAQNIPQGSSGFDKNPPKQYAFKTKQILFKIQLL